MSSFSSRNSTSCILHDRYKADHEVYNACNAPITSVHAVLVLICLDLKKYHFNYSIAGASEFQVVFCSLCGLYYILH